MSDHPSPGHEVEPAEFGHGAVRLDEGHIEGTGGLPERFENPGFPPHVARLADVSEAGAKRAEKQVAALFGLSILGTLIFLVGYFAVGLEDVVFIPGIGEMNASHVTLGLGLALALLGIGLGAVHWAKTLMPDVESVEERHPRSSDPAARAEFGRIMLEEGGDKSQLNRRPLLKMTFGGAMGLFALPLLVQLVGSLGPMDKAVQELKTTYWKKGMRLVRDPQNTEIRADQVTIGSVYHVLPKGLLDEEHQVLEQKGKAAVLLMRLEESKIQSTKEKEWGYQGIVAYSKICTHVGCPVGLYEQQTHHLLCPCHQSTFDVTNDCKVIFGPAKRPLPQLKITVDDEGYLVADAPFEEPVGPSFWERAR